MQLHDSCIMCHIISHHLSHGRVAREYASETQFYSSKSSCTLASLSLRRNAFWRSSPTALTNCMRAHTLNTAQKVSDGRELESKGSRRDRGQAGGHKAAETLRAGRER